MSTLTITRLSKWSMHLIAKCIHFGYLVCVRSVSATLLIQLRYGNELLSCSVSFKVIVYISTTFRISKHYTVQTFNLDSHKPYKNNSETNGQPKECDVPHIHTLTLIFTIFSLLLLVVNAIAKFNQLTCQTTHGHGRFPLRDQIQIRMQIK